MSKIKANFKCSSCGYNSFKWLGCCPTCNEWNCFVEEIVDSSQEKFIKSGKTKAVKLKFLDQIENRQINRINSGIIEWDRTLGGGILPGSFIILTGDPGIGKSTLLLQVANKISQNYKVLYFSSEESLQQIKNRATRLNIENNPNLLFSDQSDLESILLTGQEIKPDLLILDSIQNCHISNQNNIIPGSISSIKEIGFHLMKLAKESNIAICVTGHITKEGYIAGPKILEHIVDGVFYLQGEDRWNTRILRSVKNRFGTINEAGFFDMQENGLSEILNINQHLLQDNSYAPGSTLITSIEGSRPLILELQTLCIMSKFGIPQRVVTGLDPKRVVLVAAILEKYLHIKFSSQDIFFKLSGNFKIKDSSSDLGIALALLSSYFQKPLPIKSVAIGEISLTGQIKAANQITIRIQEAEKFGLEKIFISKNQQTQNTKKIIKFGSVYELLNLFPE
ncbi:DNA repair protein RadA [Candidatus Babeliales bacterium]|nr:DNA repair protein RadA [Candidatus Babeliales bacterium]MCF7899352.1 DNA repair protein RadA [Candidatus Babeliales bacterium]